MMMMMMTTTTKLPYYLRQTTREYMYFWSRDKDANAFYSIRYRRKPHTAPKVRGSIFHGTQRPSQYYTAKIGNFALFCCCNLDLDSTMSMRT